MKPIEFDGQTKVYHALRGDGSPYPDSALPVRIDSDGIVSVWGLTPQEREAIAAGANVELKTFGQKTPPLSLCVRAAEEDSDGGMDGPDGF